MRRVRSSGGTPAFFFTWGFGLAGAERVARGFAAGVLPAVVLAAGLTVLPDVVLLRGGIATSSCGWMAVFIVAMRSCYAIDMTFY
jgi:hypothetical protein